MLVFVMFNFFFSQMTNLINYEKESFVLDANKFVQSRKMSFGDYVYYIWANKGKSRVFRA